MLTGKQHQLLLFIDRRLKEAGVAPSYDEMKEALGLASKSGIHRLITALEERGFIRRLAHKARALEVTRLPDNVAGAGDGGAAKPDAEAPAAPPRTGFSPRLVRPQFGLSGATTSESGGETALEAVSLPLYGRIAAGTPIEALRDDGNAIEVPPSLIGSGEHYALEVDGDSMIEAGIQDGDTVIIRRCDTAENGSIVVALVDENEVTLKRLRRKGASIALEPANAAYETRIFPADHVRVQGRLVGLMRRY